MTERMVATGGRARRSGLSRGGKEGSPSERIAIVTSNEKLNLARCHKAHGGVAAGAVPGGGQGSVPGLSVQKVSP